MYKYDGLSIEEEYNASSGKDDYKWKDAQQTAKWLDTHFHHDDGDDSTTGKCMKGDVHVLSHTGPIVSLSVTIPTAGDKSRHHLLKWATKHLRAYELTDDLPIDIFDKSPREIDESQYDSIYNMSKPHVINHKVSHSSLSL